MNEPRYLYFGRHQFNEHENRYVFDTPFYLNIEGFFDPVFKWVEEYIGPAGKGCGWAATRHGDTFFIADDNHAMAFRLRWC